MSLRPLRIAVLIPSYEESESPFRDQDGDCDPTQYFAKHHTWEHFPLHKRTAVERVRTLAKSNFDLFFNLCDGASDEDRAGPEVVMALEKYGCAFTGATSHFYEPTRETMKKICQAWDIKTPKFVFAKDERGVQLALETLRFPMIVKHENSYGSIGMGESARVMTAEDLRREVRQMSDMYSGALVEEFIEGREFTVLVAENPQDPDAPLTFMPAECCFPKGVTFKHFNLKWVDFEGMTWIPVDPNEEGGRLESRLREMSALMFRGHKGTGYARCDFRMDEEGELYMLEINPNCGLFYAKEEFGSADTILTYDDRGHQFFVEHQIQVALNRQKNSRFL